MIISKTIKIKSPTLPPDSDFIIKEIKAKGFNPIRWAIVDVADNILTVSISSEIIESF